MNCDYCKVAWLDFLANPGICECFMNKPLNRGGYQVQWNKHEKNWSVRHKGKVVDRVSQGVLLKATFKHPKSGRSRARRPAIYCKKSDWFPDMGSVGDYKTTLPVRYHHGLSKWQVHFSSTEVKPVLKYEVVFITPSGDININPTLGYEGFHRILREDEWKNPQ